MTSFRLLAAHGVVFAFHVTLSILAYAAFALSFVLSLIFLSEERLLRSRKLSSVVWRLPSLELLERMSHSSVLVGVISIAIGTVLGFIWVDRLTGQYWFYDPKYVITLGGAGSVFALFSAGADDGLAWGASFKALRV